MGNKMLYLSGLCLLVAACYKEGDVPTREVILGFGATPHVIAADGVSRSTIFLELPPDVVTSRRSVVFTATKGTFEIESKNTITVSAVDTIINSRRRVIAYANLISANEENSTQVTARVQNYTATQEVVFVRAYPDSISIAVDKLYLKAEANAEVSVLVQLRRNPGMGKPSPYQHISIAAFDSAGNLIGNFRNPTLVTDGESKAGNFFSVGPGSGYLGQVRIVATTLNGKGDKLSDSAIINITK